MLPHPSCAYKVVLNESKTAKAGCNFHEISDSSTTPLSSATRWAVPRWTNVKFARGAIEAVDKVQGPWRAPWRGMAWAQLQLLQQRRKAVPAVRPTSCATTQTSRQIAYLNKRFFFGKKKKEITQRKPWWESLEAVWAAGRSQWGVRFVHLQLISSKVNERDNFLSLCKVNFTNS